MKTILVAAAALLALGGGLWWFASSAPGTRGSRSVPGARAASPVAEVERPPAATSAPAKEGAAVAPEEASRPTPSIPGPAAAREAASGKSDELAAAQWVEGRVVLPDGTPADEKLFVVAKGKDFADGSDHRVEVAPDGAFRVAFHAKTRTGRFELEGRYLYLAEIPRWKSGEVAEPVVLEPELGTRIEGRLKVPPGTDARAVGGHIELHVERRMGNSSTGEQVGKTAVTEGLAFAFDGLVPAASGGRTYDLRYDGETFVGQASDLVPEAGKTLAVELELRPGVTLAGVIRDEAGAPVAGASLDASSEKPGRAWSLAAYRDGTSAADGTFRLGALEAGEVQIEVSRDGHEPLTKELGDLEAGTRVTDLVLVLGKGLSISGRVRWPDGRPAEAHLVLTPMRAGARWDPEFDEANGKCAEDGSFTISGLADTTFRVTARATHVEEVQVTSELTGRPRTKKERTSWRAELEDVAAGTRELALTLSTGLAVTGRVVDDRGVPLADFRVQAGRVGSTSVWFGDSELARSYRDTDGTFRLEGFAEGEWELRANAVHHATSDPVPVTLPATRPVELVVPRESVVIGRVLDPSGAPVERAHVEADLDMGQNTHFSVSTPQNTTDEEGRFEVRVRPGSVSFQASGAGYAPSAARTVQLAAGEPLTGLELVLRVGGTIQGEVLGPDGAPLAGQQVWLHGESNYSDGSESDAGGQFLVTGVPPGEIRLWAQTTTGLQLEETVEVQAGATVRVRLAAPGQIVRLRGRVTAGGEPLADGNVYARRIDGEDPRDGRGSSTEIDDEGAYEVALPGPGRYSVHFSRWDDARLSWSANVDVPAAESFAFDVAIPVGRISGRVTDAHGAPLASLQVSTEPERHEDDVHGSGGGVTDAEGRYELLVPAGRHAVSAGGGRHRGPFEASTEYAEARASDLVVTAGGHLRGVDLRLERGGTLAGIVRNADGSPAARAMLWREGAVRHEPIGWTDEGGRFDLPGLPAGTLNLSVTARDAATREPLRVEVIAGETRQLEVELAAAVRVRLALTRKGAPVGAEVTVTDARGVRRPIQYAGPNEMMLGPLVPGHYKVTAQRDGQTLEREFDVDEEAKDPVVELVFE